MKGSNQGYLLKKIISYLSLQAKLHVGGLAATNSLKVECFFSKLDEIPSESFWLLCEGMIFRCFISWQFETLTPEK